MKKIAIAIVVVVVLLMQVTVYASGPATSDVSASPNPTYGAPYVALTADLTIGSNAILKAASSETKPGKISDVAKAKVANTLNLNFTSIIIEDVDSPSLVNPNESFNVTVHTLYNFSRETEVVLFLYDWNAWDQNDDYIDFRVGNISGIGNKSFVFDVLAITKPKLVNLTAVAGYKNESGELVLVDALLFPIVSLNFTIDKLKFPSTVTSNEIFNVTIETSYNVAPVTNITLAIYDWDAEKYTARSWKVLSGSNNQTFYISLTASASDDMKFTLVPYFTYEFEDVKIQGLIGHRNFTVNVVDYWLTPPTTTLTPPLVSPTAKASATSARANAGENVSFSGADSTDSDGTITSYEWDFGDGTTASGADVTHTYSNDGTYIVKLTVTDNSSLADTDTIEITVTTPRYTLSEAVDKNFVKAEMTGSGASSGDSINLKLTRLTHYTTEISVPKGTVLLASGAAQNMVVYKVSGIPEGTMWITPISKIVLDSSEPQTFILDAYCLDFHKENPSSSTKFSVGTLTDPQIIRIFDALDKLSSDTTSVGAIQTAIWVVTDDVSKKELVDRFPVEQNDIANAKVILEEAGIDATSKRLFR